MARPRLCVFVIAYQAESTLKKVLERIPKEIFETYQTEILVVDDASKDRTFHIGKAYKKAHPDVPMTVLRNERNQGYGGNQKVGYTFAIQKGFDFVAMLHGDGQYAPEMLPQLTQPLADDSADAVFGSRMIHPSDALKGGMPFYKWIGNRILTTAQNALLGTDLAEFHSGYRVYRVQTLAELPFEKCSNDFHFDTQIIIQLLNHHSRIKELAIPTYYGDEISRVNGMRYAKDVMVATLQNAAHRAGILYQRRFDTSPDGNQHYDLKLGYTSSHTKALQAVPDGATVIDIGAGPGGMVRALTEKGCAVTVVDQHESQADDVTTLVQDLDAPLDFDLGASTHILMLDVIEHLKDPERFLARLREKFDYTDRQLVLTTPNVAFIVQRVMLALGQFNYGKAGILDRTHTRLFTFRSLKRMLVEEGFVLDKVEGVPAPFPKVLGDGVLGRAALKANELLIKLSPTLFSYQIFVQAQCRPTTRFVLDNTIKVSGAAKKSVKVGLRRGRKRPARSKTI